MIVKTSIQLSNEKKRMEEEISRLRCDVITLRVTAGDYLKAAVQYQCSPWDLRIVSAYSIAKTRLEEVLVTTPTMKARKFNEPTKP